jgi:hypothetical protein
MFLGGLGRAISIAWIGPPSAFIVALTVFEILAAPILVYWQHRIAV